jgi:hypothetical protein
MRREMVTGAGVWLWLAALVSLLAGVGRARAATGEQAWEKFRGQVLFSDTILAPASAFPSEELMVASLGRMGRTTVHGRDGFWRLHAIAFLDPAPTSSALRMRAVDVSQPGHRAEVRVFELTVSPGQRELTLPDFVLSDAMGFKSGGRYELLIERAGEGKADVYAKGVITLK